jgi:hypothetical protein
MGVPSNESPQELLVGNLMALDMYKWNGEEAMASGTHHSDASFLMVNRFGAVRESWNDHDC